MAQKNDFINDAISTIFTLTQDEQIRRECAAREEYYAKERQFAEILAEKERLVSLNAQVSAEKDQLVSANAQMSSEIEQLRKLLLQHHIALPNKEENSPR